MLVAAIPSILSTGPGLRASLAALNWVSPGQVEISDLSVGWGTPLYVRGLKLHDRPSRAADGGGSNTRCGEVLLEVEEITCSDGLWALSQAAGQTKDM